MKKSNERENKAIREALEYMEYVIETANTPDFVEVIGKNGGDVVRMRFYDDGKVVEK